MKRRIIAFGNYYHEFIRSLNDKERDKLKYLLSLLETQDRVPVKFIKLIQDGLYELQKKTQKTPEKEIKKALQLKADYYEQKRISNL